MVVTRIGDYYFRAEGELLGIFLYGTFFIKCSAFNVLRGIKRNYAELFYFFELGGSLCFAQAAEYSGTPRLVSQMVSNPVRRKPPAEQAFSIGKNYPP